jgi:hypothetical protein
MAAAILTGTVTHRGSDCMAGRIGRQGAARKMETLP